MEQKKTQDNTNELLKSHSDWMTLAIERKVENEVLQKRIEDLLKITSEMDGLRQINAQLDFDSKELKKRIDELETMFKNQNSFSDFKIPEEENIELKAKLKEVDVISLPEVKPKNIITIWGKDVEISVESFRELKKQLNK